MNLILVLIISYFLGAIPFAYIMTSFITGKDVRQYGSGNVGATNAARVMGIKYGIIVGIMDIFKGFIAIMAAKLLLYSSAPEYYLFLAALLAIIGHNWPVFLKFSGGKGVATTFGVILGIYPVVFLFFILIWFLLVIIGKYVSLASILSGILLPVIIYFYRGFDIYNIIFATILALLIIIRHHSNIDRLLKGKERKINWPPNMKKGDDV